MWYRLLRSHPTMDHQILCATGINFMSQSNCSKKGGSNTLGVTQYLFAVDAENDVLWYLRVNSAKSVSIVKRKGYFKTVGVFDL